MYPRERKIPTILGLFLLFSGLGITVYADSLYKTYQSRASNGMSAEDVRTTNISSSSLTVSWLTEQPTIGSIIIQGSGKKRTLLDDQDADGVIRPRTVHAVTARELIPNTPYTITVQSGSSCTSLRCPTITQKTAVVEGKNLNIPPLRGLVKRKGDVPVVGALVYVTIGKTFPLSTRTDSGGLWAIPLTNLQAQDLSNTLTVSDTDLIQISVMASHTDTLSALLDVMSVKKQTPLPILYMGNSYNLISLETKQKELALGLQSPQTLGVAQDLSTTTVSSGLDFFFPKKDGDATSDTRPRFRGIGMPKSKIRILLDINVQGGSVTVAADGTWNSRPIVPLTYGKHTITIQGSTPTSSAVTVTRQFYVLKSGESVLGESTPSGSLTPTASLAPGVPSPSSGQTSTITPTETPPTPTGSLTTTPTPTVNPAITATLTPAITLAATMTITPPAATVTLPSVGQPVTGNVAPVIIAVSGGVLLLVIAAVVWML